MLEEDMCMWDVYISDSKGDDGLCCTCHTALLCYPATTFVC